MAIVQQEQQQQQQREQEPTTRSGSAAERADEDVQDDEGGPGSAATSAGTPDLARSATPPAAPAPAPAPARTTTSTTPTPSSTAASSSPDRVGRHARTQHALRQWVLPIAVATLAAVCVPFFAVQVLMRLPPTWQALLRIPSAWQHMNIATSTADGVSWLRYMGTFEDADEWRCGVLHHNGTCVGDDDGQPAPSSLPSSASPAAGAAAAPRTILTDRELRGAYVTPKQRYITERWRHVVQRSFVPGMYEALLARTRFIDHTIADALGEATTTVDPTSASSTYTRSICPGASHAHASSSSSSSSSIENMDASAGTYMHGHDDVVNSEPTEAAAASSSHGAAHHRAHGNVHHDNSAPDSHPRGPHLTHHTHPYRVVSCPNTPIRQLIVLGAGFDTRSLTMAPLLHAHGVRMFEIDQLHMQEEKLARLHDWLRRDDDADDDDDSGVARSIIAKSPVNVQYVPCDLSNRTQLEAVWHRELPSRGYQRDERSVVLLEGVAAYLNASEFHGLLQSIRGHVGAGSLLIFDYMSLVPTCLADPHTTALAQYVARMGEPFRMLSASEGSETTSSGEHAKSECALRRAAASEGADAEARRRRHHSSACRSHEEMLPCATWPLADVEKVATFAAIVADDASPTAASADEGAKQQHSPRVFPPCPCDQQPHLSRSDLEECVEVERMRALLHEVGMHPLVHMSPLDLERFAWQPVANSSHHVACFERLVVAQICHD